MPFLESIDSSSSGFPVDSSYCARASNLWWAVHHQFGWGDDWWGWSAQCDALCTGLREEPTFHSTELLFRLRDFHVGWICSSLWEDHTQYCLRAMESGGDYFLSSGGSWHLWLYGWGSWSAEDVKRLTGAVVCSGRNQAVIWRFDITIWCEDFECGRGGTGGVCPCESSFS